MTVRFEGRVLAADEDLSRLTIEVTAGDSRSPADRVPVMRDGSFYFRSTGASSDDLRVINQFGDRLLTESVLLRQGHLIELKIRAAPVRAGLRGGAISLTRLTQKPQKPVQRLFSEANNLAQRGELVASVEMLESAIGQDPRWFEAWLNLGSRQLRLHRYEDAARSFRAALAIDGQVALLHCNLGLTMLFLRQPAEAERSAFRALHIEPDSPCAKYVAALALLQQNTRQETAIEYLKAAAPEIPHAREVLKALVH
jgi:tetratricopeptide (TPR) repeat protein